MSYYRESLDKKTSAARQVAAMNDQSLRLEIFRATDNFLDNWVYYPSKFNILGKILSSVFEMSIFTPQNKNNWVKFQKWYFVIIQG